MKLAHLPFKSAQPLDQPVFQFVPVGCRLGAYRNLLVGGIRSIFHFFWAKLYFWYLWNKPSIAGSHKTWWTKIELFWYYWRDDFIKIFLWLESNRADSKWGKMKLNLARVRFHTKCPSTQVGTFVCKSVNCSLFQTIRVTFTHPIMKW